MSFQSIEQQNKRNDRTEVFTRLNATLPNKLGILKQNAKVDIAVEENTLRIFQKMFPEKVNPYGLPFSDSTRQETAILTAIMAQPQPNMSP